MSLIFSQWIKACICNLLSAFLNIQRDKWTYWVGKRGRLDKWKGLSLLCRKHLAGQTQRFENCILKGSCSFSKWETSFYRLPGKPRRHLTSENSLQETTHAERLLRFIGLHHTKPRKLRFLYDKSDQYATRQTAQPTRTNTLTTETLTDLLQLPKQTTPQFLRLQRLYRT